MKDPAPVSPDVPVLSSPPARRPRSIASPAICAIAALLCAASAGCSDTHSDEYVEFADLDPIPGETITEDRPPTVAATDDTTVQVNGAAVGNQPPESTPSADTDEATDSGEANDEWQLASDTKPVTPAHLKDPFLSEPRKPTDSTARRGAKTAQEPQPIKLLIPQRQFRKEGEAVRATFDDIDLLKVLNMEPVPINAADHFPDWLKQLNGARVRIRGYMRPGFEAEDITEFLFVRDNGECCYGPMPKIYDMIAVQLADGESTDLIEGTPFDVEGTFRIDPHADEVELFALFFIDDGVIID